MNFSAVTVDQAIKYYRENYTKDFNKITADEDQNETLIKKLESIITETNEYLKRKLDQAILNQANTLAEPEAEPEVDINEHVETSKNERSPKRTQKSEVTTIKRTDHILDFPPEVISNIIRHTEEKTRFSVAQTCHLTADLIHDVVGYKKVYLSRVPDILRIQHYKGIMNNTVVQICLELENLHSLLAGCKHIRTPYGYTSKMDDDDLKAIASAGVQSISVYDADKVTDEGLKALAGVRTIDIESTTVTDEGLKALKGVHSISLRLCTNITDEGIKALAGVHFIDLYNTSVTDEGVKALKGVHTINLSTTSVTDEGIKALKGVHTIDLTFTAVTDEGLKAIAAGVHTIDVSYCRNVTDEGIQALKGVHTINLYECNQVTEEAIEALKAANVNVLNEKTLLVVINT
mmetsp:Transcript_18451/g.20518  ORF Transcript_18451/g.20518 Transcript_18451/m.20518 type:complete len:405 (+) Transcript_18451:24-1238(+)